MNPAEVVVAYSEPPLLGHHSEEISPARAGRLWDPAGESGDRPITVLQLSLVVINHLGDRMLDGSSVPLPRVAVSLPLVLQALPNTLRRISEWTAQYLKEREKIVLSVNWYSPPKFHWVE